MGTPDKKLDYLIQTKNKIKQAIIDKGVTVTDTDTFRSYADKIAEIQTGNGDGEHLVRVIDYDGSILKQEYLNEGSIFVLPEPPSNHSRLVFQEWSSPVDIENNTIIVGNSDIIIGATYATASGLSEFDITLNKATGLSVTINMDGIKNWGDGTSDDQTTHIYTDYGDYMITCTGSTMTTSSSNGLFGQSTSNSNGFCTAIRLSTNITDIGSGSFNCICNLNSITIPNSVITMTSVCLGACRKLNSLTIPKSVTDITYLMCASCSNLTSVVIPNSIKNIGEMAFSGCYALSNVTIPHGVTIINKEAFCNCVNLTNVVIPESMVSIGVSAFKGCESLASVVMSNSVVSIDSSAFYHCHNLTKLVLSNAITTIMASTFQQCYRLNNITLPNNISSIIESAFASCNNVVCYDFTNSTTIPTLSNKNVFSSINIACKIYVPDNLYDEWIVATNWATYANHIYKASEMPR